jgi:hypothetical protein
MLWLGRWRTVWASISTRPAPGRLLVLSRPASLRNIGLLFGRECLAGALALDKLTRPLEINRRLARFLSDYDSADHQRAATKNQPIPQKHVCLSDA